MIFKKEKSQIKIFDQSLKFQLYGCKEISCQTAQISNFSPCWAIIAKDNNICWCRSVKIGHTNWTPFRSNHCILLHATLALQSCFKSKCRSLSEVQIRDAIGKKGGRWVYMLTDQQERSDRSTGLGEIDLLKSIGTMEPDSIELFLSFLHWSTRKKDAAEHIIDATPWNIFSAARTSSSWLILAPC